MFRNGDIYACGPLRDVRPVYGSSHQVGVEIGGAGERGDPHLCQSGRDFVILGGRAFVIQGQEDDHLYAGADQRGRARRTSGRPAAQARSYLLPFFFQAGSNSG